MGAWDEDVGWAVVYFVKVLSGLENCWPGGHGVVLYHHYSKVILKLELLWLFSGHICSERERESASGADRWETDAWDKGVRMAAKAHAMHAPPFSRQVVLFLTGNHEFKFLGLLKRWIVESANH
jgi:hypothetical protein